MTRYTPQWLQAGSYAASVDRRLIGALWPTAASSGGAATVQAGTMSVNVAAGQVAVPSQNSTGSTLCSWDAPETVTHAAAGGSGQNRIDVITCHPRGNDLDGGANNDFIIDIVQGTTVTGTATPPAVPAGQVGLYQVAIAGGSAALVAGNLTDVRPGGLAAVQPASAPRGRVASVNGPATAVSIGQTQTTIIALPVSGLVVGRRYRVTVFSFVSATATAGEARTTIAATHLPAGIRVITVLNLPSTQFASGSFVWDFTATATTDTFTLAGLAVSSGTINATANLSQISVEDIGV